MPIPAQRDPARTRKQLAAWLAPRVHADGEVAVGELRGPGATGFSNETLILDASWTEDGDPRAASYVVRVAPSGYTLFPDPAFDRQYRVLRALRQHTTIPVPAVRWYETDDSLLGAPFFVMDEVQGVVPPDNPPYHVDGWLHGVTPEHRARIWWGCIDTIADLHRVDWPALDLDLPAGGLTAQLDYYERFLASVERDEPVPVARRALGWLRAHAPDAERQVLTWGDARIGNVMYDAAGAPVAVLDWEMVEVAAPAVDVTWAMYLDRHHSEACGVPRLDGFPSKAETVARYEERSGIRLDNLDYYEVFAAFRFAVIMGRLAVIFKDWGLLTPDDTMAQDNTATRLAETVLAERRA